VPRLCCFLFDPQVGLAVDDVNGLRNRAKVVKLKMQVGQIYTAKCQRYLHFTKRLFQIDYALDVELALPESWRRYFLTTIRRERIYPNVDWGSLWRMVERVQNVIEGPFMSLEAVLAGVEHMVRA
jgi:hypothetical protein